MVQDVAWQVSIALIGLLLLVFVAVALGSGRRDDDYPALQKRAYRIRRVFFWALVLTGTPLTFYTLADLPYDTARAGEPPQVIEAVGHQWRWALSADRVVAGREVEFRVTSADVNHGFGIYDADMRLVAQTQAMPGYTNRLRHTFARPGVYRVLCMEYCGLVHHNMVVEITATE